MNNLDQLVERIKNGEELSPEVFFNYVKTKKNTMTEDTLKDIYNNCLYLIGKYKETGQKTGLKKLLLLLDRIEHEKEVVKEGINQFVYQEDLQDYIENICKLAKQQPVKLIELERYEREIPDDVIAAYSKVKDKFDAFYVLFTDYTGKTERQIEQSKKEKDPILFGVFMDKKECLVVERFYYIGDWIDEYCDLTLDRMINDTKVAKGREIVYSIPDYEELDVLRKELQLIDKDGKPVKKKSKGLFFNNVKTFLSRKNKS